MPLSPLDLPGHVLDAHLLACLLVVIVPLALGEIDAGECCSSLQSFGFPLALYSRMSLRSESVTRKSWTSFRFSGTLRDCTHIRLELDKLETATVKFDDLLSLGFVVLRLLKRVGSCRYDGRVCLLFPSCMVSTSLNALSHKVCRSQRD